MTRKTAEPTIANNFPTHSYKQGARPYAMESDH
jgi:hypothetical protein